MVSCSSSGNGRGGPREDAVKDVERLLEEKRRAELSARIASGEFTVEKPRYKCSSFIRVAPCALFVARLEKKNEAFRIGDFMILLMYLLFWKV